MATVKNDWNKYNSQKPTRDDYYLVSVSPKLILKLGLSPSPSVLIAKYNIAKREWHTVLGSESIGVGNIHDDVIAWQELPKP